MADNERSTLASGCLALGGCAGVAVGIWAAVDRLQPALANVSGISSVGASWITAAISLFGGLEIAAGAGVLACCALTAATVCVAGSCVTCCVAGRSSTSQRASLPRAKLSTVVREAGDGANAPIKTPYTRMDNVA